VHASVPYVLLAFWDFLVQKKYTVTLLRSNGVFKGLFNWLVFWLNLVCVSFILRSYVDF
jgi:hypothetical protein